MLRNIWKVRELLLTLVRRDLIVRYQSSVLGFLWSFARPLALVVIFTVAFQYILKIGLHTEKVPFSLHMLVGILAWSFLSRSIAEGNWAILSHSNLVKKIKLPVEVFPATTVIGNLVNFGLGMLVVFPIILIVMSSRIEITWYQAILQAILFTLVTALLTALAFSITLITSAVHVFYRDIESLVEVVLQAWFYATPIVYSASILYEDGVFKGQKYGAWLETLYWLNPMTPICVAYRRILLYREPFLETPGDGILLVYLGAAVVSTGLLYLAAQAIFRYCARFFADEV